MIEISTLRVSFWGIEAQTGTRLSHSLCNTPDSTPRCTQQRNFNKETSEEVLGVYNIWRKDLRFQIRGQVRNALSYVSTVNCADSYHSRAGLLILQVGDYKVGWSGYRRGKLRWQAGRPKGCSPSCSSCSAICPPRHRPPGLLGPSAYMPLRHWSDCRRNIIQTVNQSASTSRGSQDRPSGCREARGARELASQTAARPGVNGMRCIFLTPALWNLYYGQFKGTLICIQPNFESSAPNPEHETCFIGPLKLKPDTKKVGLATEWQVFQTDKPLLIFESDELSALIPWNQWWCVPSIHMFCVDGVATQHAILHKAYEIWQTKHLQFWPPFICFWSNNLSFAGHKPTVKMTLRSCQKFMWNIPLAMICIPTVLDDRHKWDFLYYYYYK